MTQTIAAIDLIRRSMYLINAAAAGEMPSDNELNDALLTLNELIDSWNLQSLAVYASATETWPLVAGQSIYTWGTGGNFSSDRPVDIIGAFCVRGGVSYPVDVVGQQEYDRIGLKGMQQSLIEKVLYVNAFPLGILTCYPVPFEAISLTFNVNRQLTGPVALQDMIALPPGYLRALRYNLAVELWPEYVNTVSDINSIKSIARESFGKIKVANSDITPSSFDDVPGTCGDVGWGWRA